MVIISISTSYTQNNYSKPDSTMALAIDPICKMKVKPTAKNTIIHQHKKVSFCSVSCKNKFLEKVK